MEVIYGDSYFLVNFSMDFLALFICCRLRRLPFRLWRTVASSGIGALYALICLMFGGEHSPIGIALSLLLPCLMVYVAFGWGRPGSYLANLLTFWVTSLLMGGAMTSIYFLAGEILAKKQIYINGTVHTLYSGIPAWAFLLCALGAALLTALWNRFCDRRARTRSVRVSVSVGPRSAECEGLVDSGNLLTEPLSSLPVVILERELADSLVPGLSGFERSVGGFSADIAKVRIIPYRSVSGGGIMYGYLPDSITVNGVQKRAVICASEKGAIAGDRRAIVPLSLL